MVVTSRLHLPLALSILTLGFNGFAPLSATGPTFGSLKDKTTASIDASESPESSVDSVNDIDADGSDNQTAMVYSTYPSQTYYSNDGYDNGYYPYYGDSSYYYGGPGIGVGIGYGGWGGGYGGGWGGGYGDWGHHHHDHGGGDWGHHGGHSGGWGGGHGGHGGHGGGHGGHR